MEIRELNLIAFGPFTDRTLSFKNHGAGFHVVYGPNEAGKSSALRALKALLYGIPERTLDNFLHANEHLRIGGQLRRSADEDIALVRRKGRKNTLLGSDGVPLNENVLVPFLQGVTQELFESLFGIDHTALVRGGQEILAQKGEVGEALFAAGIGSSALHAVLEDLDSSAQKLFLPRGSIPTINAALKKYRDLSKAIKEVSLSSREWDLHYRALTNASRDLQKIQQKLNEANAEKNRLERMQRILPRLAKRHHLLMQLEDYQDVVVLTDDFSERRHEMVQQRDTARYMMQSATERLEMLHREKDSLEVNQEILDQGESVEVLHQRLDSYRKAMQDRPHLKEKLNLLQKDADELLQEVRPDMALDQVEQLRSVLVRQRITEHGNLYQAMVDGIKTAKKSAREKQNKLHVAQEKLYGRPHISDSKMLRGVFKKVRKLGDLDTQVAAAENELRRHETQSQADLTRMGLWSGELEQIANAPVPMPQSIDRMDRDYQELLTHRKRLEERKQEVKDELQDLNRELDEIERVGAVPTEQDLSNARAMREQGWKLLQRQWILGEDLTQETYAYDPVRTLPEAFERWLDNSDEIADRLRREADRVHKKANLLARRESLLVRFEEIDDALVKSTHSQHQFDVEWKRLWEPTGIKPLPPREMQAWFVRLEKLRDKAISLTNEKEKLIGLTETRNIHRRELRRELETLGEKPLEDDASLEELLKKSEALIEHIDDIESQRKRLTEDVRVLERERQQARDEKHDATVALSKWEDKWEQIVSQLGLGRDASPLEAAAVVDKLAMIFSKLKEAEELKFRVHAIDKDTAGIQSEVKSLAKRILPQMLQQPLAQVVVELNSLLSKNRDSHSRRDALEQQIKKAEHEIRKAKASIEMTNQGLKDLCIEAECESPEGLDAVERRSTKYKDLRDEISRVEREILEEAKGVPLEQLEADAQSIDQDALPTQLEQLAEHIEKELEPKRNELYQVKGREENELKRMDGNARAADLAQEANERLETIRTEAQRYARYRLAAYILRQQIEHYRNQNQGPLLKRASEHFSALTRGSFTELKTDFAEKDEAILVGVRPSGQKVFVNGMSSGTRDQLYLALRLASLERYLETSEPMPFIVDDILIHFDDERSKATLSTLATLSKKSQVIVFTHHYRLVEQVSKLDNGFAVNIQELG